MLFSSLIFLTFFLPVVLGIYFVLDKPYRNLFLLIASLFFYVWGEPRLGFVMIISIIINYLAGISLAYAQKKSAPESAVKGILGLAVAVNLALLIYYKYFNFFLGNFHAVGLFAGTPIETIFLPVGISFYTFHSISYLVDLYRGEVTVQKDPVNLGLYITFFPQLIAGPIIRYHDVAEQIRERRVTTTLFSEGIVRFIRGLAKKVLIANNVALIADKTFDVPAGELPMLVAWLGILCYSIQIYFDFSGYSDMAIGLAKMFGINFKENFDHPYIARSIQEFWRRWHISLSTWFRDYLYIPLGGSRGSQFKTYRNLIIVFFLTGFWHGATWNFIFWGMFYGVFLILERAGLGERLGRLPLFFQSFYTLLIVIVAWVFFRSKDLTYSFEYLGAMFGFQSGNNYTPLIYFTMYVQVLFIAGIVFSMPVRKVIEDWLGRAIINRSFLVNSTNILGRVMQLALFVLCIMELAQSSYNPFIYFRF